MAAVILSMQELMAREIRLSSSQSAALRAPPLAFPNHERFRETNCLCERQGWSGEKGARKTKKASKGIKWLTNCEKTKRTTKRQQKQRPGQEKIKIATDFSLTVAGLKSASESKPKGKPKKEDKEKAQDSSEGAEEDEDEEQ
ncbi:hypothetical protein DNTS_025618 [Danionella cerebrum]|uniref:Uncharacterized protein n=1 Tax=Danionella cerebrum TaxID=2873325 RepID=A0A553QA96_9TELE|nr:hypothetical protein DNTS_025618 [Danionella translucida]